MTYTKQQLKEALLALNSPQQPFVVSGNSNAIVATWNLVDALWLQVFAKAGMTQNYRMTLHFDEATNSVTVTEEEGEVFWSMGVPTTSFRAKKNQGAVLMSKKYGVAYGLKPNLEVGKLYEFSFDVAKIQDPIFSVISQAGWKRKVDLNTKIAMAFVAVVGVGVAVLLLAILFS